MTKIDLFFGLIFKIKTTMKFKCSTEKWKKMGQPGINSVIYLKDRKTSKKVYFTIVGIDYGFKGGILLLLARFKQRT